MTNVESNTLEATVLILRDDALRSSFFYELDAPALMLRNSPLWSSSFYELDAPALMLREVALRFPPFYKLDAPASEFGNQTARFTRWRFELVSVRDSRFFAVICFENTICLSIIDDTGNGT